MRTFIGAAGAWCSRRGMAIVWVTSSTALACAGQDGDPLSAEGPANAGAGGGSAGSTSSLGGSSAAGGGAGGTGGSAGGSAGQVAAGGSASGSGGTMPNGGASGTSSIPTTVLPCDALPEPGQWQKLSIPHESAPLVSSLEVDQVTLGTIYVGAGAGEQSYGGPGRGIWKSTDCGATFVHINTGENGSDLDQGLPWQIEISPEDSNTLFATNGYGTNGLYRSQNGGVDWSNIKPVGGGAPNFVQGFSMDPLDPDHLLVTFHEDCTGEFAPQCIAETTNGGDGWRVFKGPGSGWAEGGGVVSLGGATFLYAADEGLWRTSDSGDSWEKIAPNGKPSVYRIPDLGLFAGSSSGILMSTDGAAWTKLDNSHKTSGMVSDGTFLYAAYQNDFSGHPYFKAPLDDLTAWTQVPSPEVPQGANNLGYDPEHHVLYSSNYTAGMWRLVLE